MQKNKEYPYVWYLSKSRFTKYVQDNTQIDKSVTTKTRSSVVGSTHEV